MYVRRAYEKRIWNACYFYTDEPHFLKSRTKSLNLILKKGGYFVCLFAVFVCLFVCLSKLGYVFTLRRISKKRGQCISFKLGHPIAKFLKTYISLKVFKIM